ncbi:MAG: hypothetical protein IPM47_07790 [Sphingobacteriales bacterium]|nr:MAG: hypothetical protein IPM47_07790 [Sphingobacteriales bacterium]
MNESTVASILNSVSEEFGWKPWGTPDLAKTQAINSNIVLSVHKSKRNVYFNLGVIPKIIANSEVEFKLYVEEREGGIQVWTKRIAGKVFDNLKEKYKDRKITFSTSKTVSGYKKLAYKTYKNVDVNNLKAEISNFYKTEWEDIIADLFKVV